MGFGAQGLEFTDQGHDSSGFGLILIITDPPFRLLRMFHYNVFRIFVDTIVLTIIIANTDIVMSNQEVLRLSVSSFSYVIDSAEYSD